MGHGKFVYVTIIRATFFSSSVVTGEDKCCARQIHF
jgi:hypothetical protein